MNAVTEAIRDIKFEIPNEILEIGLLFNNKNKLMVTNIDDLLLYEVIRSKVIPDCTKVDCEQLDIPMSKCPIIQSGDNFVLVEIPKRVVNGKTIVSAMSLLNGGELGYNPGMMGGQQHNGLLGQTIKQFEFNMDPDPIHVKTSLQVVGENRILITDYMGEYFNGVLRVAVANDVNMSRLKVGSMIEFSQLCVYATQAYLYNNLIVTLNKNYLYNGHELGIVKSIIEEYRDSIELYKTHLKTVWGKVSFMNDNNKMHDYLGSMFSMGM